MKSRWLINLGLLLLIAGIATFLHLRPKQEDSGPKQYEVSALKIASFSHISVEFPAKAPVQLEKVDGYWRITQPYQARADQRLANNILAIVAATTKDKFPANDLAKFGLDNPKFKLKLDGEEFVFGTNNPLTSDQYVLYKDAVYLLPVSYAEAATTQPIELIDKNPMKPTEKPVGFDFSRLEQWEDIRLNVDLVDGKWKASAEKAKPGQDEMNAWFDERWLHGSATSVEPYTPDRKATYPSFEVKLAGGKKVHFDKLQESPEMLLGRPDEGLIYHIAADVGFSMLNPPINLGK